MCSHAFSYLYSSFLLDFLGGLQSVFYPSICTMLLFVLDDGDDDNHHYDASDADELP